MRKSTVLSLFLLLGVMVGCSEEIVEFNDKDIDFKVVHPDSNAIKITNGTEFDLVHLTLKVSYPELTEKNTYETREEFTISSGQTKELPIMLDLQKGIEFDDLEIDLNGNVLEGKEKIPFQMGGTLGTLDRNS